jgi:hypothetical protein
MNIRVFLFIFFMVLYAESKTKSNSIQVSRRNSNETLPIADNAAVRDNSHNLIFFYSLISHRMLLSVMDLYSKNPGFT